VILTRRDALWAGGAFLAGLPLRPTHAANAEIVQIIMHGNTDGSLVWFDPIGVLVRPGQTVRWTNKDPGNSHTSTAYHPANDRHPLRIPAAAKPWNSDYLLPDQSFETTLTVSGVYDYFCFPHEHAGMVGRLVVAEPGDTVASPPAGSPIEGIAVDPFPLVEEILRQGRVTLPKQVRS
jgi:plastocyanin